MDLAREQCDYASCYCEENVYQLAKRLSSTAAREHLAAVFISNSGRRVPLFAQKAAGSLTAAGFPVVVWDYHVILMERKATGWFVWDLDSTLPFPSPFGEYFSATVKPEVHLPSGYERYFRVIPVPTYLTIFSSDRSHMLKEDGTYSSPPPSWPAIWNGRDMLQEMISMAPDVLPSQSKVYSEHAFHNTFCR